MDQIDIDLTNGTDTVKKNSQKPVYAYVPREDHKILDRFHEAIGMSKSDFVYIMIHLANGLGVDYINELSTAMLLGGPNAVEEKGAELITTYKRCIGSPNDEYIDA